MVDAADLVVGIYFDMAHTQRNCIFSNILHFQIHHEGFLLQIRNIYSLRIAPKCLLDFKMCLASSFTDESNWPKSPYDAIYVSVVLTYFDLTQVLNCLTGACQP